MQNLLEGVMLMPLSKYQQQPPEPSNSSYELKLKLLAENRKAAAKILSQALSRLEANNSIPHIQEIKSRQT